MPQFYFVRHGQSQANVDRTIAAPDSPLTDNGAHQAADVAAQLAGLHITKIVCSPFARAKQTAEVMAGVLGIDPATIQVIDNLRERGYGPVENQPKVHPTPWYYTQNQEGMEPTSDLLARMITCLAELKEMANGQRLLVVGHAVSGFYLRQAAAGHTHIDQLGAAYQLPNAGEVVISC